MELYELWWREKRDRAAVYLCHLARVDDAPQAIADVGAGAYEAPVCRSNDQWTYLEIDGEYVVTDRQGNEYARYRYSPERRAA